MQKSGTIIFKSKIFKTQAGPNRPSGTSCKINASGQVATGTLHVTLLTGQVRLFNVPSAEHGPVDVYQTMLSTSQLSKPDAQLNEW